MPEDRINTPWRRKIGLNETYKDVNSFLYAGKIMLLHDAAVNCS